MMKREMGLETATTKRCLLVVAVFLLAAPVCVRAAEVTNLRCEYRESPLGSTSRNRA